MDTLLHGLVGGSLGEAGFFAYAVAFGLVDVALKSFVLLAIAWCVAALLRRRSAATLHGVWTLGFGGCLLIPLFSLVAPAWNLPVPAALLNMTAADAPTAVPVASKLAPRSSTAAETQVLHTGAPAPRAPGDLSIMPSKGDDAKPDARAANSVAAIEPAPREPHRGTLAIDGRTWGALGMACWAIVAGGILLRTLWQQASLARIVRRCESLEGAEWTAAASDAARRLGLKRGVRLLKLDGALSPLTAGVVRPVVVLPASADEWPAAKRRSVLLHELGHVRRHDVLIQLAAGFVRAAHWFNPLCWHGLSQMRKLRELACDDLVLASGQRPADYAENLLEVARSYRHRGFAGAVGMARDANVEKRILAILDSARSRVAMSRRAAFAALAMAGVVAALLGSMRVGTEAEAAPGDVVESSDDDAAEPQGERAKPLAADERVMEVLITDDEGKPLEGARLHTGIWEMRGARDFPNSDYFTDASGVVNVVLPKNLKILRLWPHKLGYVPEFTNYAEGTHDEGAKIPERYHFKLTRGTELGGVVVDEDGNPIPGVNVEVAVQVDEPAWGANPDPMISHWLTDEDFQDGVAVTDDQGRWSINNAPAQAGDKDFEFRLKFTHDGYVRDGEWGELQRAQGIATKMLRDRSARIVLGGGTSVTGTVVDADGKPVPKGLVIWSDDPYLAQGVNETAINESGHFATIRLPSREFPITLAAPGFRPERRMVMVEPGMAPLKFVVQPGKRLAMKFIDQNGKPIPKAYVGIGAWREAEALYNHHHPNVPDSGIPTEANDEGVYVWDWAPADAVTYRVSARGYAESTVTLAAVDHVHVVTLAAQLTVSGRVTDAKTGAPIPEFRVVPVAVWGPKFWSTELQNSVMGKNGAYKIEFRTDSENDYTYQVRIEAEGYRSALGARAYPVGAGAVVEDIALEPAPAREGFVVDAAGQPIAGAAVVVGTPTIVPMMRDAVLQYVSDGHVGKTDADGRFDLAATFEPMLVRVAHDSGFAEVLRGVDEPIGRIELRPWASLSGQLVQDGKPVAEQQVYFQPAASGMLGEPRFQDSYAVRTDAEGRFEFKRLPPTAGSVRAYLGPWRESPLTSSQSMPFELRPGEKRTVVLGKDGVTVTGKVMATGRGDVPLDRNWSLNYLVSRDRGIVVGEQVSPITFNPAEDATTAWSLDPNFEPWLASRENYFVKLTPDGDLHISGVPAGRYFLLLRLYEQPAGCLVQTVGERVVPVVVSEAQAAAGTMDLGEIEVPCRVGPREGENMQAYKFTDASGRERTVFDMRGKYVLMHVWASWCQPCLESMPEMRVAVEDLPEGRVEFVGLNVDESPVEARRLADRRGWNWAQNYLGEDSAMARQLAISSVPSYFLIGPDGLLVASATEWSAIKGKLDDALTNTAP